MNKLDKAYKAVFVIYAPIALLSIGLKIFDVIPVSYISYVFSALSAALGIVIVFLFIKSNRGPSDENDSFFIKRKFIIPFLIFSLISHSSTSYFLYSKGFSEALSKHSCNAKTRIVLLLPCNNNLGAAWEDGVRQILGLTYFFRDHPDYTSQYEFRIIDHSMKYDETLKASIIDEIEKGTKIFISSMSKVSEPLSKDFGSIISSTKYSGDAPILICTVASSPEITTSTKDNIFRFYIRSQEEGILLAEEGRKLNFEKAAFIVVNDAYGEGAIKEFTTMWERMSGKILGGAKLNSLYDDEKVDYSLQEQIKIMQEADVIFLAHYGSGVDKVFRALDRLDIQTPVLATHTLTIPDWQKPIREILQKRTSYSCKPKYATKNPNHYEDEIYDDAISGFMYWTLDRLIYCLTKTDGKTSNFADLWKSSNYPDVLEHTPQNDGDIAIKLEFVKIEVK